MKVDIISNQPLSLSLRDLITSELNEILLNETSPLENELITQERNNPMTYKEGNLVYIGVDFKLFELTNRRVSITYANSGKSMEFVKFVNRQLVRDTAIINFYNGLSHFERTGSTANVNKKLMPEDLTDDEKVYLYRFLSDMRKEHVPKSNPRTMSLNVDSNLFLMVNQTGTCVYVPSTKVEEILKRNPDNYSYRDVLNLNRKYNFENVFNNIYSDGKFCLGDNQRTLNDLVGRCSNQAHTHMEHFSYSGFLVPFSNIFFTSTFNFDLNESLSKSDSLKREWVVQGQTRNSSGRLFAHAFTQHVNSIELEKYCTSPEQLDFIKNTYIPNLVDYFENRDFSITKPQFLAIMSGFNIPFSYLKL